MQIGPGGTRPPHHSTHPLVPPRHRSYIYSESAATRKQLAHQNDPLWVRKGVVHGAWPGLLLPQLARLPYLETLSIHLTNVRFRDAIPAAWGAPGAFPRLKR